MNECRVNITSDESTQIELLFYRYNAYLAILSRLNLPDNSEILDKKITETAEIYILLEQLKAQLDNKYHPTGHWTSYEFDFINHQMVYRNEE